MALYFSILKLENRNQRSDAFPNSWEKMSIYSPELAKL